MVCPPNQIYRKSYTRKNTGKVVKSACVHRSLGLSRKEKKFCPPGKILRKSYIRKISKDVQLRGYTRTLKSGKVVSVHPKRKSVKVAAKCVKDMGKTGKLSKLSKGAPIIGPLKKGELKKHGYSYKLPEAVRRQSLQRAIKEFGTLSTYRKLNAVAKLTSSTSPNASKTFSVDRNWIRKTYGLGGRAGQRKRKQAQISAQPF